MGLSTDHIVNVLPSSIEHLLCSICHEILWRPVTCETCEHSFCEACLSQWFQRQQRCPNTCEYRQRARSPHLLVQLLSQLKVTCKNMSNGCTQVIPYEGLENHEQTCGYEMKSCQGCLQSLLKQDLHRHELECDHVEILCNNCQVTYHRRDGHDGMQCLRNQMKNQNDLFERKITSLENDARRQTELLNSMNQQQKTFIERLDQQSREAEEKTRKIIRFDDVPPHQEDYSGLHKTSYDGFLWTNCKFILWSDESNRKCPNAFKPGQQSIVYTDLRLCYANNGYGQCTEQPMSIATLDKGRSFNIESIEALSITDDNPCDTQINGMRNNQTCFTRKVRLHNELQLITLNWTNIDTLTIQVLYQYRQRFEFAISEIVFTLP